MKTGMRILFIIHFCLGLGLSAFCFYQAHELLILKKSHKLVEGIVESIEHKFSGKSSTDFLICSYDYNGKLYQRVRTFARMTRLQEDQHGIV
jgi:hypothetical protein